MNTGPQGFVAPTEKGPPFSSQPPANPSASFNMSQAGTIAPGATAVAPDADFTNLFGDSQMQMDSINFQAQVDAIALLYAQHQQQQLLLQQQLQQQQLSQLQAQTHGQMPTQVGQPPTIPQNLNMPFVFQTPMHTPVTIKQEQQFQPHFSVASNASTQQTSTAGSQMPIPPSFTPGSQPPRRLQPLKPNTEQKKPPQGPPGVPPPPPTQTLGAPPQLAQGPTLQQQASLQRAQQMDLLALQQEAQRLLSSFPQQAMPMQMGGQFNPQQGAAGFPNTHRPFLTLHQQQQMAMRLSPGSMSVSSMNDDLSSGGSSPPADLGEVRRSAHILAEQKRRNNIKQGFEELQAIIPACKSGPTKVSKATILQKAIDYITYILKEKTTLLEEVQKLRQEVQQLRMIIAEYQRNELEIKARRLADLTQQQDGKPFDPADLDRFGKESIKFMVFCTVVDKLFETFNAVVSLDDSETFSTSLLQWFEQYCCPEALRETFLTSLQSLSSCVLSEESAQKLRRWGTALSAVKDSMVTTLDNSGVPLAKQLSSTIDTVSGYLGASESPKPIPQPPQQQGMQQIQAQTVQE
eukprot:comp15785_c0_seq1/m.13023 comp15785_c0_seq1/g.13023  ORF comp15785_c0_seq1/g.13023 comp15785_c0_seq1/m.13023 type:complete len:576 (-) comp15785_c0_seq1:541-2268(-)